jgi:hypothetical protein
MSPPLVCPRPGAAPDPNGRSCPLWPARAKVQFQGAIEAASAAPNTGLGAAVWFDMNHSYRRPGSLPTRPPLPTDFETVPIVARPIAALLAGETVAKSIIEKEVPANA